ncbi:MAG TPA: ArdC-like ssDNA-binding domain-containing protein [Acidimicrobiales bacterium]
MTNPLLVEVLADTSASLPPLPTEGGQPRSGQSRDYSGLLESLTEGIAELTTSEKWKNYLNVQSKFYQYSFNNALLIALQKPNASRVAGYKKWTELKHQVRKGEKGIVILAPIGRTRKVETDETAKSDEKEEKKSFIVGFTTVNVFDVSQTDGPPLPEIASKLEGRAPEGVFDRLTEFANSIGFRVERPESLDSGANGDTSHSVGLIRVVSANSEAQQAKTLAHEIGHALLHDPGVESTKDLTRGLKELEAESVAYVVSQTLGLDTSDYSFGYVVGWTGGAPEAIEGIKTSAGRIQKAATAVLKTFEVDQPTEDSTETENINVVADRSFDDERMRKYRPLSAAELEVLDTPTLTNREFGIGR